MLGMTREAPSTRSGWLLVIPLGLAPGLVLAMALAIGCGADQKKSRYSRHKAQLTLGQMEQTGLVLGEFALAGDDAILDGDTIKVAGIATTLRLLAIDTEETFKNQADLRASENDFKAYLAAKRKGKSRPVKAATPMGEEAKKWAKKFFDGVDKVRLERDHAKEVRGRYNRYLAYVLAWRDGKWVNYNVECVRAGMSPYFTKYGYSRRFHEQFVQAENEARQARRGIWSPNAQGYPDYPERKAWWDARAEFIQAFERDATGRDDYIVLTNWDSIRRLEANLDREVTLLASVSSISLGDRGPTRVMLGRRQRSDFPLIFFDKDVFGSCGIAGLQGEFVRVSGSVSLYHNKRRNSKELQIVVTRPGQIIGSSVPESTASAERAQSAVSPSHGIAP